MDKLLVLKQTALQYHQEQMIQNPTVTNPYAGDQYECSLDQIERIDLPAHHPLRACIVKRFQGDLANRMLKAIGESPVEPWEVEFTRLPKPPEEEDVAPKRRRVAKKKVAARKKR